MKSRGKIIGAVAFYLLLFGLLVGGIVYAHLAKPIPKPILDAKADTSSENGKYAFYRVYTGIRPCTDCDGIATRIILKSVETLSDEGIATIEALKIEDGKKPARLPLAIATWKRVRPENKKTKAYYTFSDNEGRMILSLVVDGDASVGRKDSSLTVTRADGTAIPNASSHMGKFLLVAAGKTK